MGKTEKGVGRAEMRWFLVLSCLPCYPCNTPLFMLMQPRRHHNRGLKMAPTRKGDT
jgi:hypothetical protein